MLCRYPPLPSLSRDSHVIVLLTALLVLIVSGGLRSPVVFPVVNACKLNLIWISKRSINKEFGFNVREF